MLKIAVVGNNYKEVKDFAKNKFENKIEQFNATRGIFILKNGDEIHLCYKEENKDMYLGTRFDAFVITPQYYSLVDLIKLRSTRL